MSGCGESDMVFILELCNVNSPWPNTSGTTKPKTVYLGAGWGYICIPSSSTNMVVWTCLFCQGILCAASKKFPWPQYLSTTKPRLYILVQSFICACAAYNNEWLWRNEHGVYTGGSYATSVSRPVPQVLQNLRLYILVQAGRIIYAWCAAHMSGLLWRNPRHVVVYTWDMQHRKSPDYNTSSTTKPKTVYLGAGWDYICT
jgi:hypothetical protein